MIRPGAYSYAASVKSDASDERINVYLLRPIAGVLVGLLYRTPVTPNQVTVAAIAAGLVAAILYAQGHPGSTLAAGLCLTLKDLLDSADGQLARAKEMYSRAGRFLDSIGDLLVNFCVFAAIILATAGTNPVTLPLGVLGFLGISLRVSYHVFYQSSFLHLERTYQLNRLTEVITDEDRRESRATLRLQQIFQLLYGWQDRMMERMDAWSRRGTGLIDSGRRAWYGDRLALRLSGFLGLGTELFVLMLFSVANRLELYLWVNVVAMNAYWAGVIGYRRAVLWRRVSG